MATGPFGIGRILRKKRPGRIRTSSSADLEHLQMFASTRTGVEAFVEPRTAVTETTILLVAADGEWTRRRVDGPSGAVSFAKRQGMPLYEAAVVGYPQRMREYNARQAHRAESAGEGPSSSDG